MSSDNLYHRLMRRVLDEELDEDGIVRAIGQVARGEKIDVTYVPVKNEATGESEMQISRKRITSTPVDVARGLMFMERMPGMTGLGLTQKGLKEFNPDEGIKQMAPEGDFTDIVWGSDKQVEQAEKNEKKEPDANEDISGSGSEEYVGDAG